MLSWLVNICTPRELSGATKRKLSVTHAPYAMPPPTSVQDDGRSHERVVLDCASGLFDIPTVSGFVLVGGVQVESVSNSTYGETVQGAFCGCHDQ